MPNHYYHHYCNCPSELLTFFYYWYQEQKETKCNSHCQKHPSAAIGCRSKYMVVTRKACGTERNQEKEPTRSPQVGGNPQGSTTSTATNLIPSLSHIQLCSSITHFLRSCHNMLAIAVIYREPVVKIKFYRVDNF